MSLRWQKYKRLLKRADYQVCYNLGNKQFTKFFVLFVRKAETMRIGIAVSKKCGNAVARNRIKRVLREFFRLNQGYLGGIELIIVAKKHLKAKNFSYNLAQKDLLPMLEKFALEYKHN